MVKFLLEDLLMHKRHCIRCAKYWWDGLILQLNGIFYGHNVPRILKKDGGIWRVIVQVSLYDLLLDVCIYPQLPVGIFSHI